MIHLNRLLPSDVLKNFNQQIIRLGKEIGEIPEYASYSSEEKIPFFDGQQIQNTLVGFLSKFPERWKETVPVFNDLTLESYKYIVPELEPPMVWNLYNTLNLEEREKVFFWINLSPDRQNIDFLLDISKKAIIRCKDKIFALSLFDNNIKKMLKDNTNLSIRSLSRLMEIVDILNSDEYLSQLMDIFDSKSFLEKCESARDLTCYLDVLQIKLNRNEFIESKSWVGFEDHFIHILNNQLEPRERSLTNMQKLILYRILLSTVTDDLKYCLDDEFDTTYPTNIKKVIEILWETDIDLNFLSTFERYNEHQITLQFFCDRIRSHQENPQPDDLRSIFVGLKELESKINPYWCVILVKELYQCYQRNNKARMVSSLPEFDEWLNENSKLIAK